MLKLTRLVAAPAAALAIVALAPACVLPQTGGSTGSSGGTTGTTDPPVIDALNMSASASVAAGTDEYVVSGSITYHDDDDVVVSAQVYVYVTAQTLNIPIAVPYQESEAVAAPFSFDLSADPPLGGAGPTDYTVTLTNKSGAVSAPIAGTVTLL